MIQTIQDPTYERRTRNTEFYSPAMQAFEENLCVHVHSKGTADYDSDEFVLGPLSVTEAKSDGKDYPMVVVKVGTVSFRVYPECAAEMVSGHVNQ